MNDTKQGTIETFKIQNGLVLILTRLGAEEAPCMPGLMADMSIVSAITINTILSLV